MMIIINIISAVVCCAFLLWASGFFRAVNANTESIYRLCKLIEKLHPEEVKTNIEKTDGFYTIRMEFLKEGDQ